MKNKLMQSTEVMQILDLAEKNHWGIRLKEFEEMPERPVYRQGWWYLPVMGDDEIIPEKAKERVEAIRRLNIPITGLVLGHEAPRLLPVPKPGEKPKEISDKEVKEAQAINAEILGSVIYLTLSLAAVAFEMIFELILIDPALYVMLPDGCAIEVLSWLE